MGFFNSGNTSGNSARRPAALRGQVRTPRRTTWRDWAASFGMAALLLQVLMPMGYAAPVNGNDDSLSRALQFVCSAYAPIQSPDGNPSNKHPWDCPVCQLSAQAATTPPSAPGLIPPSHVVQKVRSATPWIADQAGQGVPPVPARGPPAA